MVLPWVRIDTGIASHDKILALLNDPSPQRWRAFTSYVCSIGWSAEHSTDGEIPRTAFPFIWATSHTAELLVKHELWEVNVYDSGWTIHNYALRQQLAIITEAKREQSSVNAQRAACSRWHGPQCWGAEGCSRA